MITAALPGSGEWGGQREGAGRRDRQPLQRRRSSRLCWCGKSGSGAPGDAALSAADELELVG
ncbi:hypothetical protein DMH17_13380 [Raoultella planticola]|nr:hypothetical protein [Raoultella planticola]